MNDRVFAHGGLFFLINNYVSNGHMGLEGRSQNDRLSAGCLYHWTGLRFKVILLLNWEKKKKKKREREKIVP